MRGVRAVGGDQAAAFVIENIQRTQKEISTGDLIPPPHLERRLRLQCEYLLMFLTT